MPSLAESSPHKHLGKEREKIITTESAGVGYYLFELNLNFLANLKFYLKVFSA